MTDDSSPLDHLLSALGDLSGELDAFGKKIIASPGIAQVITNLNREQLDAGEYATGGSISPDYTPFTKFLKEEKGQPSDRVTLRDTGEFYADLRVEFDNDSAEIVNENEKAPALKEKYGEDILGLSDDSHDRVSGLLLPNFEGYTRHELLPKLLER